MSEKNYRKSYLRLFFLCGLCAGTVAFFKDRNSLLRVLGENWGMSEYNIIVMKVAIGIAICLLWMLIMASFKDRAPFVFELPVILALALIGVCLIDDVSALILEPIGTLWAFSLLAFAAKLVVIFMMIKAIISEAGEAFQ